jgi:hypothetical protein
MRQRIVNRRIGAGHTITSSLAVNTDPASPGGASRADRRCRVAVDCELQLASDEQKSVFESGRSRKIGLSGKE